MIPTITKQHISVFAPATVANLSCGFDVLGTCLDNVGDPMRIDIEPCQNFEIEISKITGANLPYEPEKNVVGVAIKALQESYQKKYPNAQPFKATVEIHKKIKAGSGIGSSAASSTGAVYGVNKLLGDIFDKVELISFAMEGERLASGNAHADNVAPALLGGFSLVRSYTPLDVIKLHTPKDLYITVIHPQIEVKTADSRAVLKQKVNLKNAIHQWGNLGGFIAGLYSEDYKLMSRSLQDVIVEPLRSILIPKFQEVKQASLDKGALGCGISGSGPSIYALSKGIETAQSVQKAMENIYSKTQIPFDIHVSKINTEGIKITERS